MDVLLYTKDIKCPVCSRPFTTTKVKASKLRVKKRDSDFLTEYKGEENPLFYGVFLCPHCGYGALEGHFQDIKPAGKAIIKEKISSKWVKRDYSNKRSLQEAIETHKLALYCGELSGLGSYELGTICLRLGWLYRILQDESEMKFLKFAVEQYKDFYITGNFNDIPPDEVTLSYLIGEIYRRIGNYKEAVAWFSRTIANPLIKDNPRVEKQTREQWQLAKETGKEVL